MSTIGRPHCTRCGALLRRGRQPGLCHPCQKVGLDPRAALPADFFDRAPVMADLAVYDFGTFFRTVRGLTSWTQQTLGGVVGLSQATISAIERGEHRLRNVDDVASVARGLAIPPARLNFPDIRATVGQQGDARGKDVSWVERRDFGQHIAAAALGIAGAAGLDLDRLLALLPQAEPTGTRHVGAADVEVIEQLTAAFVRQDFAHGSGLVRDAAVAQLHTVLPLQDAQVTPEVRPQLMLATARLAMQSGWMSFECKQHDAARRLWMIGLDLARNTDHPQADDLTVFLLYDLALQAVHLGHPKEALHLVRVGHTAAVGRYPVSPSTTCRLANAQALAQAAEGDGAACDRALGEAAEQFSTIDPATRPPWGAYLDESRLASYQGDAYYTLAMVSRDSQVADKAALLLRHAVDHFGPAYARLQASSLAKLAGAHALAGDTDTAVAVSHEAIDAVTAVSSPRAYDRLRTLHTVLEPLHPSPGVGELRDRLAGVAA
ncbi:MAG: helix-turn-helix domain-containing protein [Pseudonocardiaceae bacterium]